MMAELATFMIVSPEQLSLGYLERQGMIVTRRRFVVIRRREDGNYVVRDPEKERREE